MCPHFNVIELMFIEALNNDLGWSKGVFASLDDIVINMFSVSLMRYYHL